MTADRAAGRRSLLGSTVAMRCTTVLVIPIALGLFVADVFGQPFLPGAGRGPRGPRGRDATFIADRDTFHYLLAHHDKVRREVTFTDDGVTTVTESDDPEVRAKIREHVRAMVVRMEKRSPVRMWDPLFAELFRHAKEIEMVAEDTEKGIRVSETSENPRVVELIQAHAKVVSGFAERGFEEASKSHPLPVAAPPAEAPTPAQP